MGVEILGEKLLLFRDSAGVAHCLSDVCPHRGAPLHQGWVSEVNGRDCVVCPYHGWCARAPSRGMRFCMLCVQCSRRESTCIGACLSWHRETGQGDACRVGVDGCLATWCCRAFDADGVLRDVPAAEHSGEWPQKALISAYPVEERVRAPTRLYALCMCRLR